MLYWMKTTSKAIMLVLAVVLWGGCQPKYQPPIEVKTMQVACGWGYKILINDTLFIYQPHVPSVPGERRFVQRTQAKAAGELVKEKIIKGKSPALRPEDLKALKISSVSC